jgi:hypothetical protein
MLDLLVGIDAVRRLTEEGLVQESPRRARRRKTRRVSRGLGRTASPHIDPVPRSVECSRETPTGRPSSTQASPELPPSRGSAHPA